MVRTRKETTTANASMRGAASATAVRAALFCGQFFFKIRKTPPKDHCLRNFRRAIAGKQAILLTDNFLRRNLMRKPTKTERAVLDLLRQGYRPKSHRAAIVSQL
jgi:hypothetical protein